MDGSGRSEDNFGTDWLPGLRRCGWLTAKAITRRAAALAETTNWSSLKKIAPL